MALSGFTSVDDFLEFQNPFKETMAAVLGSGMSSTDIITIKVCHESDCTTFWSVRRNMLTGKMADVSPLGFEYSRNVSLRQLLGVGPVVVKFQANVPVGTTIKTANIYQVLASASFLSSFANALGSNIGRSITAQFTSLPSLVTEESGEPWMKPSSNYKPDLGKPTSTGQSAFEQSLEKIAGLSFGMLVGIALLVIVGVCLFLLVFVLIPYYKSKALQASKQPDSKLDPNNQATFKREIHPAVKIPSEFVQDKQEPSLGNKDEQDEKTPSIGGKRKPPQIHEIRAVNTRQMHDISSDSEDCGNSDEEKEGKLSDTTLKVKEKFGYAKLRLQQLQSQLDSILKDIPEGNQQKPLEPSPRGADVSPAPRPEKQYVRIPPLITRGGKAHAMITQSTNFQTQNTFGTGNTSVVKNNTLQAAVDSGWAPAKDDDELDEKVADRPPAHDNETVVRGADGRKLRLGGQMPDSKIQPAPPGGPPPARRPPNAFHSEQARVVRKGPSVREIDRDR
jgi:hypothetical protein